MQATSGNPKLNTMKFKGKARNKGVFYLLYSGSTSNFFMMPHYQVETVFHEFRHALQHMLRKQDEGLVAGIMGIEWDAVELPSQFMENWCYHKIIYLLHVDPRSFYEYPKL